MPNTVEPAARPSGRACAQPHFNVMATSPGIPLFDIAQLDRLLKQPLGRRHDPFGCVIYTIGQVRLVVRFGCGVTAGRAYWPRKVVVVDRTRRRPR
jgi:hypothetical protein